MSMGRCAHWSGTAGAYGDLDINELVWFLKGIVHRKMKMYSLSTHHYADGGVGEWGWVRFGSMQGPQVPYAWGHQSPLKPSCLQVHIGIDRPPSLDTVCSMIPPATSQ
ncbi:unnamed protein product [Pleuronectes platessa]|uniref:Uncharacterized protein n=1 Tax=Pleuronectes platessa TaxID=8262 RepID=A0A9N7ULK8_PLEPL|nr:unnamed protein product [Pleuronectes platessa]